MYNIISGTLTCVLLVLVNQIQHTDYPTNKLDGRRNVKKFQSNGEVKEPCWQAYAEVSTNIITVCSESATYESTMYRPGI